MSKTSEYIEGIAVTVDKIDTCEALRELKDRVEKEITALIKEYTKAADDMVPKLVVPVDLGTTIIWIKGQIDTAKKLYDGIIGEIAAVTAALAHLTAAIEKKANILNCDWKAPPETAP
jgi:hypothetical protein